MGGGPSTDEKEQKKSAAGLLPAALLLKLALDVQLCRGDGVRMPESEQEQTLRNYGQGFIT